VSEFKCLYVSCIHMIVCMYTSGRLSLTSSNAASSPSGGSDNDDDGGIK
jgi:hypothetical protein